MAGIASSGGRSIQLSIQLLGRPRIVDPSGAAYQFRSRKSWALLAYLILAERPPSRRQLAGLLFDEADDPGRALRWNLAEIRRALGDHGTLDGDPVVLQWDDIEVDVEVVMRGSWRDAIALPGLGEELLDGVSVRAAAAFDTWLLVQQRRLAAASEAILHEAALGSLSTLATLGDRPTALGSAPGQVIETALAYAVRASALSPLDENHQALVIRLLRLAGDDAAAARQYAAFAERLDLELGVTPGAVVQSATRETAYVVADEADASTVEALVEAGSAAVAAGAVDAGVRSLGTAARLADRARLTGLSVRARLVLAEALVHALGGLDEEGLARLYEADEIARAHGLREAVAQARAELGYVDFLRARYDRAERWLTEALAYADGSPSVVAKATTYLGSVASDRADYPRAAALLADAITWSRAAGEPRREAYALAMLGRVNLLRDDLGRAGEQLDEAMELGRRDHWVAFMPWPQGMRGEVYLRQGDLYVARRTLEQAFARACQLRDPCWEGMAARGLALLAEASGQVDEAFMIISDARTRCNRRADPYVWLDGYILQAQCAMGERHDHPDTSRWVETLATLAARTGMQGFQR